MAASAGAMRERIVVQQVTDASDGGGGYVKTWSTLATLYAYVKPLSGREPYTQGQISPIVQYEFTIRYRTGITPANRITWNGKIFNIRSVVNADERDKYLTIRCDEGVAA